MDTERSRRHASKILTYPITIGSVLHQYSNLTLSNQRLTPEGSRSLAGRSIHNRVICPRMSKRVDQHCEPTYMFLPVLPRHQTQLSPSPR